MEYHCKDQNKFHSCKIHEIFSMRENRCRCIRALGRALSSNYFWIDYKINAAAATPSWVQNVGWETQTLQALLQL